MHPFNVGCDGVLECVTNSSIIKHWPREGGTDQRRICDVSNLRVSPDEPRRSKRAYQNHLISCPERAIYHGDDAISQDTPMQEDNRDPIATTASPLMQQIRTIGHTIAFVDDDAGGDTPDQLFAPVRKKISRSFNPLPDTCLPEKEHELLPIGDARRMWNPAANLTNTPSAVDPRTLAELVSDRMQVQRRWSASSHRASFASFVALLTESSPAFDILDHPVTCPSEARSGDRDQDEADDTTMTSAALMYSHHVESQVLPAGLRSKARIEENFRLSTDRLSTLSVVLGIASEVKIERYRAKEVDISQTREHRERAGRSNHGVLKGLRGNLLRRFHWLM